MDQRPKGGHQNARRVDLLEFNETLCEDHAHSDQWILERRMRTLSAGINARVITQSAGDNPKEVFHDAIDGLPACASFKAQAGSSIKFPECLPLLTLRVDPDGRFSSVNPKLHKKDGQ